MKHDVGNLVTRNCMFKSEIEYGIIIKREVDTVYGLAIKVLWADGNLDWLYCNVEEVEVVQ